jgi:hypothetical protein
VEHLAAAQRQATALAKADLQRLWGALNLTDPEQARDLLLEYVPELAAKYGDIAAEAAAEWYEQVRAQQGLSDYMALTSSAVDPAAVQGSVRYAAGNLFTDDPTKALALLSGAMQRWVMYSGRQTVARNARHDPSKPRFARVPTGDTTCAFCSMMASRGFVYYTKQTAGLTDKFHDDCDCQICAEWDRKAAHIEGYDPDKLYAEYQAARQQADGNTAEAITASMRRMFPESYSDGITTDLSPRTE